MQSKKSTKKSTKKSSKKSTKNKHKKSKKKEKKDKKAQKKEKKEISSKESDIQEQESDIQESGQESEKGLKSNENYSNSKNEKKSQKKEEEYSTNLDTKFTKIFSQNTKLKYDFELCSVFQPDFFDSIFDSTTKIHQHKKRIKPTKSLDSNTQSELNEISNDVVNSNKTENETPHKVKKPKDLIIDTSPSITPNSTRRITDLQSPSTPITPQSLYPKIIENNESGGLQNLGNTCYFNSVLQCLLNIPQLKQFFLKQKIPSKYPISFSFRNLMINYWKSKESSLEPLNELYKKIINRTSQFKVQRQEDAHEFLVYLLEKLDDELKVYNKEKNPQNKKQSTKIQDLFQGEIESTIKSQECTHQSTKTEVVYTFELPIQGKKLENTKEIAVLFVREPYKDSKVQIKLNDFPEFKKEIAEKTKLDPQLIYLYSEENSRFVKKIETTKELYNEVNRHIYAIEIEPQIQFGETNAIDSFPDNFPVEQTHIIGKSKTSKFEYVGYPFLIQLREGLFNKNKIFELVTLHASRITEKFRYNPNDVSKQTKALCKKYNFDLNEIKYFKLFLINSNVNEIEIFPTSENVKIEQTTKFRILWNPIISTSLPFFKMTYFQNLRLHNVVNKTTLKNCLDGYTTEEELNYENKWYCEICKKHVMAKKQISIKKFPKFSIFQLKRFDANGKFNTEVDYGDIIVLNSTGIQKPYYFFAAINHQSSSVSYGHYTSVVHIRESLWYHFDDNVSKKLDENKKSLSEVYLLFYTPEGIL